VPSKRFVSPGLEDSDFPFEHFLPPLSQKLICCKKKPSCHCRTASRNMAQEYEMYYRNEKGIQVKDIPKFNVLITTFEIIIADCLELREFNWRLCVIDEAHRLKNRNCKLLEGLRLLNLVS